VSAGSAPAGNDSFETRRELRVGDETYVIRSLGALLGERIDAVPYSTKVLLENVLRHEDGRHVTAEDIEAVARRVPGAAPAEIAFSPARILMQDFTGVPCLADLAALRDAVVELGAGPDAVDAATPVDLVVDHSIQVDRFGDERAMAANAERDYQRNGERYQFLAWGRSAFGELRVVPPNTGICHQVNLEHLATVVRPDPASGEAYPDTVLGTDSHTPMVNGLGVVGWGVGGIEAEAAMLGEPVSLLVPSVVGVELVGALPEGSTSTDLVLSLAERLRAHGVVGKFVEFHGDGLDDLPVATRATIGNMSPEYGSTISIFPIDDQTLAYLRFTGRSTEQVALVEAYAKEQALWRRGGAPAADYDERLVVDLAEVEPSLAGPARPQDRIPLRRAKQALRSTLGAAETAELDAQDQASMESFPASDSPAFTPEPGTAAPPTPPSRVEPADPRVPDDVADRPDVDGAEDVLADGQVVIAAITSCTNTSNPDVMIGAGLLARNAVARGLHRRPWVKTSLAPGSRVVTDYLRRTGLDESLDALGFDLVGYGCTTCIGNSGPLDPDVSAAIAESDLSVCAVLSGNRNFEGRIHPEVRLNYLASPPLVVAYAIAGTMDVDLLTEPLGVGTDGPVHLRDIWPSATEIAETVQSAIDPAMFADAYGSIQDGDERWRAIATPEGVRFPWSDSTYIRRPPYFDGMQSDPPGRTEIRGARILALLGDSVTTDHISPAGTIRRGTPAADWLEAHGVEPSAFNSYGSRRGNHEVMVRGTFANGRLRNRLVPGVEGGITAHQPSGDVGSIFDVAMRYADEGVPLVVVAGREYGTGSSRDWAAKGTLLLGVRAVIAESFERIHRSNLVGMGVLPLELVDATADDFSGTEAIDVLGWDDPDARPSELVVAADGVERRVRVRVDTGPEWTYLLHGGVLPYVARQASAAAGRGAAAPEASPR
jgi:aconitate hydratase